MATSDSFASLSRHSRRGVSPTLGHSLDEHDQRGAAPMSIGAVDDSLLPPLTNAPLVPLPASASRMETNLAPSVMLRHDSPIVHDPFVGLSRVSQEDEVAAPKIYKDKSSGSPFLELTRGSTGNPITEKGARNDIHAVKVVTRLVQGVSFHPGSRAPANVKSTALKDLLVQVNRLARDVARAAAPLDANKPWVLAQCSEAVAKLIADRNERGPLDAQANAQIDTHVEAVCTVLASAKTERDVAQALDDLGQNEYVEAINPAIVRDRLRVSIAAATWSLHERVVESGYLYGMSSIEMVEALTADMFKVALESNILISSLDMQTTHLQGSVRRLGGLIAAEYVSRSRRSRTGLKKVHCKGISRAGSVRTPTS